MTNLQTMKLFILEELMGLNNKDTIVIQSGLDVSFHGTVLNVDISGSAD